MFLTCKFMKVDPSWEVYSELMNILLTSGKGYTYHIEERLDASFDLNFYVRSVSKHNKGKLSEVYYEDLIPVRQISKEGENFYLREVIEKSAYGPVYICTFEREPLENYVGILAGNRVSGKISAILRLLLHQILNRDVLPLRAVKFLIETRQREIRRIPDFYDVVELIVENIGDQYVDWAWMKGTRLDQSEEYRKFVESQLGGILKVLAIKFRDRTYYLYNDGRIFTRQADISSSVKILGEIELFYEIVKRLHEADAIR